MTDSTIRVYVNARGYDVKATASALDAVRAADETEADGVVAGSRLITDSRGLPVPPETAAYAGVIYRVIVNRARDTEAAS